MAADAYAQVDTAKFVMNGNARVWFCKYRCKDMAEYMGIRVQCFWLCHYRLVRHLHSCSRNPSSSPSRSLECSLQAWCRSLALWFRHGWTGACTSSVPDTCKVCPIPPTLIWDGNWGNSCVFVVFCFLPHESPQPWFGTVIEEILVFLLFLVFAPWIPPTLMWDGNWGFVFLLSLFSDLWHGPLVTWPTWLHVFSHIASLSIICSFLNVGANFRKPLNWTPFSSWNFLALWPHGC